MNKYILVAIGGFVGSLLRYGLSTLDISRGGFSMATFIENITGAFLLGVVYTWFQSKTIKEKQVRWLLGVGLIGSYTTFSTFSLDLMKLLISHNWLIVVGYLVLTIVGGLGFALFGMSIAKRLTRKGGRNR